MKTCPSFSAPTHRAPVRTVALLLFLGLASPAVPGFAQEPGHGSHGSHGSRSDHQSGHAGAHGTGEACGDGAMHCSHHGPAGHAGAGPASPAGGPAAAQTGLPNRPGEAVFGALAEIVARLEADPATDWSRVDLDALRGHLVDMHRVFSELRVAAREELSAGVRYRLVGDEPDLASARRMLTGHARMVDAEQGWALEWRAAEDGEDGLVVEVTTSDADDLPRLRALGFFGMLAAGDHHARHHLHTATTSH